MSALRRRGKLLLLDTGDGPTVGLRFGMTGRLLVDGVPGMEHLEYGSDRAEPAWDRFTLAFAEGGELRIRDPRRLGGVELDPDEDRLGPDALDITPAQLREIIGSSRAPLKARLMDQHALAGVGNLLVDEALWRAGIDPARPANSLSAAELRRLHRHLPRRSSSSGNGAARTPATSKRSDAATGCARRTARPFSDAGSAGARRTRVLSTNTDRPRASLASGRCRPRRR